jgi:transposase
MQMVPPFVMPKTTPSMRLIEAAGATLRYLPPYSPDLNLIEQSFAKLKAHLRKAKERTIPALYDRIGVIVDLFSETVCQN